MGEGGAIPQLLHCSTFWDMISPNFISIPVTFIPHSPEKKKISQKQLEVQLIDTLASDMGYYMERATQYLHVVVSLLVFFAKTGDGVVKAYMAKAPGPEESCWVQMVEALKGRFFEDWCDTVIPKKWCQVAIIMWGYMFEGNYLAVDPTFPCLVLDLRGAGILWVFLFTLKM